MAAEAYSVTQRRHDTVHLSLGDAGQPVAQFPDTLRHALSS
jgi:hypothetical protein